MIRSPYDLVVFLAGILWLTVVMLWPEKKKRKKEIGL